ncbi:hypothetical protein ABK040_004264 [Willaertia magna]
MISNINTNNNNNTSITSKQQQQYSNNNLTTTDSKNKKENKTTNNQTNKEANNEANKKKEEYLPISYYARFLIHQDTEKEPCIITALWLLENTVNTLQNNLQFNKEKFENLLFTRIINKYKQFKSILLKDVKKFKIIKNYSLQNLQNHLIYNETIKEELDLQIFLNENIFKLFNENQPLWECYVFKNYKNGILLFWRIHHSLGDGQVLSQCTFSLCDVYLNEEEEKNNKKDEYNVKDMDCNDYNSVDVCKEGIVLEGDNSNGLKRRKSIAVDKLMIDKLTTIQSNDHSTKESKTKLKTKLKTILYKIINNTTHYLLNLFKFIIGFIYVIYVMLLKPISYTIFKPNDKKQKIGKFQVAYLWEANRKEKALEWGLNTNELTVENLRKLSRKFNCKINDIFVGLITGACDRYYQKKENNEKQKDVYVAMGMDIRPNHQKDSEVLIDNHFGINFYGVKLNCGKTNNNCKDRMKTVTSHCSLLRKIPQALCSYYLLQLANMLFPQWLATKILFLGLSAVTIASSNVNLDYYTNEKRYFMGYKVNQVCAFIPLAPFIGVNIMLTSFEGKVGLTVVVDKGMEINAEEFLKCFVEEFLALCTEI